MKKAIVFAGMIGFLGMGASADRLYTDTYLNQSGVIMAPISTGIPNSVSGSRLLHWHRYVVRLEPVYFTGEKVHDDSEYTLEQLEELIRQNRSKIRYVSLIGHSSAVEDEENRIELGGLTGLFQSLGGRETMPKEEAVTLVNSRLRQLYDLIRDAGFPASRIYTENRLDRQPLSTEATSEGRSVNNRVEVALYATAPLSLADLRIQFALDSARILPEYDERVRNFAEILRRNPSMRTTIVGHTDRRGSYGYNMALSKRRAEAVKARLVELGISSDRIRTEGKGYTRPIASGSGESAHRLNRRIEAKIYR
jgi:outer membrane protein OmpA-like peptidoglycan-associated protein